MCEVLDGIFYFVFRQGKLATDEECDDLDLLCLYFGQLWRQFFKGNHLTPKFHLLENHVPQQFREFRTLGEFTEESIEREHHRFSELARRFNNIKNYEQKVKQIGGLTHFANDCVCDSILEGVLNSTKRKSPASPVVHAHERRLQERQVKSKAQIDKISAFS